MSRLYVQRCNCQYAGKEIRIRVENGEIISATLQDGKEINTRRLKTIKQLFEYTLETIKKEEWEGTVRIDVTYDQELGYPSRIKVDNTALIMTISNLDIQSISNDPH